MATPAEQIILVDSDGQAVDIDVLVEKLRGETERVLADDEVGLVLYVGDLGLYNLKPTVESRVLLAPPGGRKEQLADFRGMGCACSDTGTHQQVEGEGCLTRRCTRRRNR